MLPRWCFDRSPYIRCAGTGLGTCRAGRRWVKGWCFCFIFFCLGASQPGCWFQMVFLQSCRAFEGLRMFSFFINRGVDNLRVLGVNPTVMCNIEMAISSHKPKNND